MPTQAVTSLLAKIRAAIAEAEKLADPEVRNCVRALALLWAAYDELAAGAASPQVPPAARY